MFSKRWATYLATGLGVVVFVALDQWVKIWAIANLQGQPNRNLIPGLLHLTYVENTGAAFGFLAGFGGAQVLLTVVKLVIMVVVALYFVRLPFEARFMFLRVPLILMFAGGIGNLIDRVRLGFVVDMFAFSFVNFPVFNVADICVTVGVFCFAIAATFIVKDAPLFGIQEVKKPVENLPHADNHTEDK